MAVDLQELHDEIENDPQGIGYKTGATWKGDDVIAALLNDPANGATIERSALSPDEIIEQIDIGEWRLASAEDRSYVQLLTSLPNVSTQSVATQIREALLAIFGGGSETRTNLISVVQRQGSRAEVLWGENELVSAGDVGRAANL